MPSSSSLLFLVLVCLLCIVPALCARTIPRGSQAVDVPLAPYLLLSPYPTTAAPGSVVSLRWSCSGCVPAQQTVSVYLRDGTMIMKSGNITLGNYNWTVPLSLTVGTYTLHAICDQDVSLQYVANFTVRAWQPRFTILSPSMGALAPISQPLQLRWTCMECNNQKVFHVSWGSNNGVIQGTIANNLPVENGYAAVYLPEQTLNYNMIQLIFQFPGSTQIIATVSVAPRPNEADQNKHNKVGSMVRN